MHMMLREYDALLSDTLSPSLRSGNNPKKLAVTNPHTSRSSATLPDHSTSLSSSTLSEIFTIIDSLGEKVDQDLNTGRPKGSGVLADVFLFLNPDNANAFVNHRR